jgi:2-keto-4-pentenoate hydratase/2-oxohepta-3-ene-1,7-dioic acid hydratase in catechol pathway
MKLVTFTIDQETGPIRRVGGVDGEDVVDLTAAYGAALERDGEYSPAIAEATVPPDMSEFLGRGDRAIEAAETALAFASDTAREYGPSGGRIRYDREEVTLESPVPRPNSLRDFMVFEEHVVNSLGDDIPDVWYEMPIYYKGNPDSVVGPGDDVEWPSYSDSRDYELEIAAVIGRRGRNITPEDAMDHIAGFTIFNDFSARDIQMEEMAAELGPAKGKDFANALGPYLVTPEEFDVESATMTAEVNGEVWSEGDLGTMYHDFGDIVAHASDCETLYPGDVLGSGTVGKGCGLELDRYLSPGDVVSLTVEGLGTLENRIVDSSNPE